MSAWAAEVRARGVADVAAACGLEARMGRSLAPCPSCQAPRRGSSDGRGPVGLTADGLGWQCHRCQAKGDAVTLAALVIVGAVPGKGDAAGWRAVAEGCAAHGLTFDATPTTRPRPALRPAPVLPPEAPPIRPPEAEVAEVWERAHPVTDDPEVRAWLDARKLDPARVAALELAKALPRTGTLPAWATYRGASWRTSSHRVLVPLYDAAGRCVSLHARAVQAVAAKDKAASPKGAAVTGLVFADYGGRYLLAGTEPRPECVIVSEGVPDFLTRATLDGDGTTEPPPVLGVIAGSWRPEVAARIPTGATVIIRTHHDAAGHAYAETIRASLAGRCVLRRPTQESTYAGIEVLTHGETPGR